jgi:hypothetical protein
MVDDPVPLIGVGAQPVKGRIQFPERRGAEIDFRHDQRSQK